MRLIIIIRNNNRYFSIIPFILNPKLIQQQIYRQQIDEFIAQAQGVIKLVNEEYSGSN